MTERPGRDLSDCSIIIPALDEEATLGGVLDVTANHDPGGGPEVIVVDGGSVDATADVALDFGCTLVDAARVLASFGPVLGKGDSVWRGVSIASRPIVVVLDGDLRGLHPDAVIRLVHGLHEPGVHLVKGDFRRRSDGTDGTGEHRGRVTALAAQPLLRLLRPDLARFHQPLSGQVAIRRQEFAALTTYTGYGLEIGMLVQIADRFGAASIVEVDIGDLANSPSSAAHLEHVASHVIDTALHLLTHRPLRSDVAPRPPLAEVMGTA